MVEVMTTRQSKALEDITNKDQTKNIQKEKSNSRSQQREEAVEVEKVSTCSTDDRNKKRRLDNSEAVMSMFEGNTLDAEAIAKRDLDLDIIVEVATVIQMVRVKYK